MYNGVHEYKVYMVQIDENEPGTNVIDIPGRPFCYTYSRETARKTCQILESVTGCQDLKYWNRQTLKQVQQIIRIMHRINIHGHIYPIPFEKLKAILGWNLAAWAVTLSYKKMIETYKLGYNDTKISQKVMKFYCHYDPIYDPIRGTLKERKMILHDLINWVEDPKDFDPIKFDFDRFIVKE
jgi:hypothetical protein